MAEVNKARNASVRRVRHKGRGSQVLIYLGKQFRFFINENDWKVLPMAAIIAALVAMVIRNKFFINMEGSLIGAFALTCVAIWNGCFNSIQSVCRERPIIKREHRSGMHVSAYVAAHMIYQFFLCVMQAGLSMYVFQIVGIQFPDRGFMTPWMMLDIGISMLLVSYAADMMSLFISSISHTTTGAMTVMPFVLIFQLVFSGGIIPLPAWSAPLSDLTVSTYGIQVIAAQAGYNHLPMVTGWNTLAGMKDSEIGGTFTVGQVLDMLDSPAIAQRRDTVVLPSVTVGQAAEALQTVEKDLHVRELPLSSAVHWLEDAGALEKVRSIIAQPAEGQEEPPFLAAIAAALFSPETLDVLLQSDSGTPYTVGDLLTLLHTQEILSASSDKVLNQPITLGAVIDTLKASSALQERRDQSFTVRTTVGELLSLFGKENVKQLVQQKTAAAARKPAYETTVENVVDNWITLGIFALFFALLATLALELIDKDKR